MTRLVRAFLLCCLLGAVPLGTVSAAKPILERIPIADVGVHDDSLSALCGFDVWVDATGHITFRTLIDANGDPVRDINNYAIRVHFYSSYGSVDTVDIGPDRAIHHDDGSITLFITGNVQPLQAPGEGRVYSDTGWSQIHITFDEQGNASEELIAQVGKHDEDAGLILCGLLGPA